MYGGHIPVIVHIQQFKIIVSHQRNFLYPLQCQLTCISHGLRSIRMLHTLCVEQQLKGSYNLSNITSCGTGEKINERLTRQVIFLG